MDKLDLLLVNPGRGKLYQGLGSISGLEPPFWAGLIAAFIRRHGYEVAILDADAENLSPEEAAERVAQCEPLLTAVIVQGVNPSASSTPKMADAGEFLRALKDRDPARVTIMGGIHPSALPERTLREEATDFVFQGEGFYTIEKLLRWLNSDNTVLPQIDGLWCIANNLLIHHPRPELLHEDELPPVAWDLLPMDKYRAHNWHCLGNLEARQPYATIYSSLGCPYNCHFCNIHEMYLGAKPSIRFRKPEDVIDEIDLLVNEYGVRNIKIMDELFTLKRDRVSRICDLIIERGYDLNMWAYGRVDLVDGELLKKMKRAGINWICYGFESANEVVRRGVAKRFGQNKMYEAIFLAKEVGMHIQANFIFGLPDDDLQTMQDTLGRAKANNFEWVNFYCCTAYPGSRLYEEAIQKGVKLPATWADYGQYSEGFLPLPTKHISGEEALRFRDNAFKEYFTKPRYLEMIEQKFGEAAVTHIREMLKHEIKRVKCQI